MTNEQLERRNAQRLREQQMVLQDILRRRQHEREMKAWKFWRREVFK